MDASDRRGRAGGEAADWFARLQAGTMERAEREQFIEWLRESHIHVAEMLRIAQIQGSLARFQGWERIATGPKTDADNVVRLPSPLEWEPQVPQDCYPHPPSPRTRAVARGLRFFAVAATIALIIATAIMVPRIRGEYVETNRGERREVVLSDGSILQVDPETQLRVRYAEEARRVFLERGRALFHVAKNPNRPFLVYADDTTVRAVGTVFGVERQTQGVVVTVAEGKVAVIPTSRATAPAGAQDKGVQGSQTTGAPETAREDTRVVDESGRATPELPGSFRSEGREGQAGQADKQPEEVFLTANQQIVVADSGPAESVQEVDSRRALAWAEGRLIFQNDEVGRILAEFNRYNRVQLTVTDQSLAAKPVSGVFNAAEPEAFIAFLQSVTPIEVVRDGDRSITIRAARPR
jgi:transmembrane sensor